MEIIGRATEHASQTLGLLLPQTYLIRIGHRMGLEQFHSKILLFTQKATSSDVILFPIESFGTRTPMATS